MSGFSIYLLKYRSFLPIMWRNAFNLPALCCLKYASEYTTSVGNFNISLYQRLTMRYRSSKLHLFDVGCVILPISQ